MIINTNYTILNSENEFVDFMGINKAIKDVMLKITLENGMSIKCSENHIFLVNNMNVYANTLTPNICYLSTISGDSIVKEVNILKGKFELYDIVDAVSGYSYITNGIISHNCSFLGSGDNFISEEFVKRIEEEEQMTPIREEYEDLCMWIWEDPLPDEEYVITLDASAGHGEDNSTVNVFKIKEIIEDRLIKKNGKTKKVKVRTHKMEQVAEYYSKIRPQTLGEIGYIYGKKYNDAYCIVDVTGGYGGQAIERLLEMGYPNIHYSEINHKPTRDKLSGYVKVSQKVLPDGKMVTVDLIPGFFIGQNRGSVLTEMQRAINLEDVIIRSVRMVNEIKTFITIPGTRVADHKRSFHDDSIMGMACAIYVVNYQMRNFRNSQSKTKKMLDAFFKLEGDEVLTKEEKHRKNNQNSRTPDYTVSKTNPYGANDWLFKGLK